MRKLFLMLCLLFGALYSSPVMAQTPCSQSGKSNTLYCVPILSVEDLHIAGSSTNAVVPAVPPAFSAFNSEIGIQISDVPTPSPESGIVFSFGPSGLSRERDLGPIFSERPSTVGRHKLYLAFTYQYFEFDKIDNVSLDQIPLLIGGAGATTPFIATENSLQLQVHQLTSFATFGLFNRVDLSVAVPVLDVRMGMQTKCSICGQVQPNGSDLVLATSQTAANATGIGDVTVRVKATVIKGERAGLAIGADVRTPSGNAQNFLGAGAVGVRPFAAFGLRGRISPHATIGYQVNGSSILASTDQSTAKSLPNLLTYTAGLDVGLMRWLGVSGDLLGTTFFNANRLVVGSVGGSQGLGNSDVTCSLTSSSTCQGQTFDTNSFAIGAKFNPAANFVIDASVLIKLDDNGLHYKPAPMIGISYTF